LYRADKVQRRAARVGFDWDKVAGAWDKVHEELDEIHALLKPKIKNKKLKTQIKNEKIKEEIGDLLFAVVNVARKLNFDAEEALQASTSKFIRRFKAIEEAAKKKGKKLSAMTLPEMDQIWKKVKKSEG